MADIQPIKDYVAAVNALRNARPLNAALRLANAFGVEKPTPVIQYSIQKFLKSGTIANDIALVLVAHQVGKRRTK